MGLLPDRVRDCQARHHLLECKFTESISEESFQQALTYDYLYRQSQQLSPADLQTYVLSAQTPPRSITNAVTPTADKMADTIVGTLVWFAKDV